MNLSPFGNTWLGTTCVSWGCTTDCDDFDPSLENDLSERLLPSKPKSNTDKLLPSEVAQVTEAVLPRMPWGVTEAG